MNRAACVLVLLLIESVSCQEKETHLNLIEDLIVKWAPLIWMAPEEKYLPLRVEEFLENVHIADEQGRKVDDDIIDQPVSRNLTKKMFLITNEEVDFLQQNRSSFLYGRNPLEDDPAPVYAVVTYCPPQKTILSNIRGKSPDPLESTDVEPSIFFHVTYWIFYPYNEGKPVCILGNVPVVSVFGRCLGRRKTMLNHVGDWEHMSLAFEGQPYPKELFLSVHDAGVYYKYDPRKNIFKYSSQVTRKGVMQRPKFPPIVRTDGTHPEIFSAYGSHGLWPSPGEHCFVRVPKFTDKTGFGIRWQTWSNIEIFHLGINTLPNWMLFNGRWGNPKSDCLLFKKLGICVNNDGPSSILRDVQDYYCI